MLSADTIKDIRRAKIDALCGKILHTRALPKIRWKSDLIDYLGYVIPIGLLVATIIVFRKKADETTFMIVADVLGAVLLFASILKTSYGWARRIERHSHLLSENVDLIREADLLLQRRATSSPEAAEWFLRKADSLEKEDLDVFGELGQGRRRTVYREALMQFGEGEVCPECGASPRRFTKGACQLCGGTPVPVQHQSSGAPALPDVD